MIYLTNGERLGRDFSHFVQFYNISTNRHGELNGFKNLDLYKQTHAISGAFIKSFQALFKVKRADWTYFFFQNGQSAK